MNTTEDEMKKKPPTPSERDAARIAALERGCVGWMDAAERFQRERDTSDAVLVEIEVLLPPPTGDDQGIVSRVRRVVVENAAAHTALDAMPCTTAPGCDTLSARIKYATAAWLSERKEASHLAGLCDAAHRALDEAGLVRGGTPAQRIGRLDAKLTSAVELASTFGRVADDIEAALPPAADGEQGLVQRVRGVVNRCDNARTAARRIASALGIKMETDPTLVAEEVERRVRTTRETDYATQQALHRISDAVGHAHHTRDGVRADEVADAVGAYVRRHEHPAVLPAPSEQVGLSPRDRAILAPLLDIIDDYLFDDDAGRALAAVRAVLGVERG